LNSSKIDSNILAYWYSGSMTDNSIQYYKA
jgi:hypothetical protein